MLSFIIELEHYSRPMCNELCASCYDASLSRRVVAVVNKLDRRLSVVDNTIDLTW